MAMEKQTDMGSIKIRILEFKKYIYYLGKALREELLDKNIIVLLLCPGNIDTEMNPKGQGRQIQKINKLPFLDMSEITAKALEKADYSTSFINTPPITGVP